MTAFDGFPERIQEYVVDMIRADAERLEADCAEAMALQEFEMLERLVIVDMHGYRAVASWTTACGRTAW